MLSKKEKQFYKVDGVIDDDAIVNYGVELPNIILRYYPVMLVAMLLVMVAFSVTDNMVHQNILLFYTRIPSILLVIVLIILSVKHKKKRIDLLILVNNLFAISLIIQGVLIVILYFNTSAVQTSIVALIMLTVASYFFVKGFKSIILVYSVSFLLGIVLFAFNVDISVNSWQRLMNPTAIFLGISIASLLSEKSRFKEFYYKHGFIEQKNLTEKLYLESLAKNEELNLLNGHLSEVRENLEQSNSSKDLLFSIISHDLKSPFNALLGFSRLVIDEKGKRSKEELESIIAKMYSTSENAYKLLQNLLEWSVLQSGSIKLNKKEYLAQPIINEVFDTLLPLANKKKIALISEIDNELSIKTDNGVLSTILRNLISNAIKFSNINSEIKIQLIVKANSSTFIVEDKGVGIPSDKLEQLFKISSKQSTKGTNNEEGTGLGLHLCKELVEILGGKISITSVIGKGTNARVIFPLK